MIVAGTPLRVDDGSQRLRRQHCSAQSPASAHESRLLTFGFGFTTLALANVAKQQGW